MPAETVHDTRLAPPLRVQWTRSHAIVNLRGDPGDAAFTQAVGAAIGLPLPLQAGECPAHATRRIVWAGPDDWFVIAEPHAQEAVAAALRAAAAGTHHAVTDVSSGYAVLALEGLAAAEVLVAGLPAGPASARVPRSGAAPARTSSRPRCGCGARASSASSCSRTQLRGLRGRAADGLHARGRARRLRRARAPGRAAATAGPCAPGRAPGASIRATPSRPRLRAARWPQIPPTPVPHRSFHRPGRRHGQRPAAASRPAEPGAAPGAGRGAGRGRVRAVPGLRARPACSRWSSCSASRDALVGGLAAAAAGRRWRPSAVYLAVGCVGDSGTLVLTLAAGAMFGLGTGLLVVSFASSLGALAGVPGRAPPAARGGAGALRRQLAAVNAGMRRGRPVLPASRCGWCRCSRFGLVEPADGPRRPSGAARFYVGQPARHAAGHGGVRARGHAARAVRTACRTSCRRGCSRQLRAAGGVPAAAPAPARAALQRRRLYARWPRPRALRPQPRGHRRAARAGWSAAYVAAAAQAARDAGGAPASWAATACNYRLRAEQGAHPLGTRWRSELREAPGLGVRRRGRRGRLRRRDAARAGGGAAASSRTTRPRATTSLGVEVLQGHARMAEPLVRGGDAAPTAPVQALTHAQHRHRHGRGALRAAAARAPGGRAA
jgi:heterotetrameric sarcosine oxidase gamma subunit